MGNGSSTQYSSRNYDYRPFTGPVIPAPSQMTHANSTATGTGSTIPSYDMPRRKKKWYRFGKGRDRHRGPDVWYSAYVSPRGQHPPTPNIYGQFTVFSSPKHISNHNHGPLCLQSDTAAYQRPPDRQRGPSMPVPMTTQYGSLHIPDGYIPPSVNPPVIPEDPSSRYWSRPTRSQHHPQYPSQGHYRMPSRSHSPVQPINPILVAPPPFPEPTSSVPTSSLPSPPFKPFQPLPEIRRIKPPTPPPKLLELAPYRDTFSHLSHPSPDSRSRALEIIQNREKTDIHRVHEEWRKRDEEREKIIREKKEERERLISGASTITAPTMQTVTALVVDPTNIQQPPPPPRKEKKPFWRKFFHPNRSEYHREQSATTLHTQAHGPVIIPIGPQQALPSIPGVVVPVQIASQTQSSSSTTMQSSGRVAQPTLTPAVIPVSPRMRHTGGVVPDAVGPPVIMPSPYVQRTVRSTTPDILPPPTAAFFSIPAPVRV